MNKKTVEFLVIGLIAGFLSSFFGIGGGLVLIPALLLVSKLRYAQAAAISLISVIPIIFFGLTVQLFLQSVNLFFVSTIVIGAFAGAYIGVHAAHTVNNKHAVVLFSMFLIIISLYLLEIIPLPSIVAEPSLFSFLLTGLFVGLISGFFGLSGGVFLTPVLLEIFQFTPSVAVVTSLASLLPIVCMSAFLHHTKGAIPKMTILTIVPGAIVGVLFGSLLVQFVNADIMSIVFSFLLLFVSAELLYSVFHKEHTPSRTTL